MVEDWMQLLMSTLIRAGGIFHDLTAANKHEAFRELVARLPLPANYDRAALLSVLEARETKGSTGIGEGIAVPHTSDASVMRVGEGFITLGLLRDAIEFNAIDRKPVFALFMIASPTVQAHLRVLGQLGFLLRDSALRDLLRQRASSDAIIERIETIEHDHPGHFQSRISGGSSKWSRA